MPAQKRAFIRGSFDRRRERDISISLLRPGVVYRKRCFPGCVESITPQMNILKNGNFRHRHGSLPDIIHEKQQVIFYFHSLYSLGKTPRKLGKYFPKKLGKSMSGPFRPVVMKAPDIASGGKKGSPNFRDGIH